jgi:hypothetical protein
MCCSWMRSGRFVSAIEMGGSGSLSRMPTSEESRYGAPNFVVGTGVGQRPVDWVERLRGGVATNWVCQGSFARKASISRMTSASFDLKT